MKDSLNILPLCKKSTFFLNSWSAGLAFGSLLREEWELLPFTCDVLGDPDLGGLQYEDNPSLYYL